MRFFKKLFGLLSSTKVEPLRPLTKEELEEAARHQRELDYYVSREKSKEEIGLMYERYIGYLLENDGYYVHFNGALKGLADLGVDLVVQKDQDVLIIQAKCWAQAKTIEEESILRLIESTYHYRQIHRLWKNVKPIFYSTTKYSRGATHIAKFRNMELRRKELSKSYPMIKCNVNAKQDRIFHLPVDEAYDKVSIDLRKGDLYASTAEEAIAKGFRRAYRYRGPKSA